MTLKDRYCQKHGIEPGAYTAHIIQRALYPHARWVWWLVTLDRRHDTADIDFASGVGRLTRMRDFESEAHDYRLHPSNAGFLRQGLRLRVSVVRMRREVRAVLHEGTNTPFAGQS